jgi:hypothetical protein
MRSEGQRVVLVVWSSPSGPVCRLQVHDPAMGLSEAVEALRPLLAQRSPSGQVVVVSAHLDDEGRGGVGAGDLAAPHDHPRVPAKALLAHARTFLGLG